MSLTYPLLLLDAVNDFFTVAGRFDTGTFVVDAGATVQLLVEEDPVSTVQLRAPHQHAREPFDIPNDQLEYAGGASAVPSPAPVHEEARLAGVVEDAARRERIPVPILKGLVHQESRWSPTAVSPTGPVGLMQFTRNTAVECGLSVGNGEDERLVPEKAAPAGAAYLRRLHGRFPEAANGLERWRFALAAYNQGRGAVNNAIRAYMAATGANRWPPDGTLHWADVAASWDNREGVGYVERILGASGAPAGWAADRYGYGR